MRAAPSSSPPSRRSQTPTTRVRYACHLSPATSRLPPLCHCRPLVTCRHRHYARVPRRPACRHTCDDPSLSRSLVRTTMYLLSTYYVQACSRRRTSSSSTTPPTGSSWRAGAARASPTCRAEAHSGPAVGIGPEGPSGRSTRETCGLRDVRVCSEQHARASFLCFVRTAGCGGML